MSVSDCRKVEVTQTFHVISVLATFHSKTVAWSLCRRLSTHTGVMCGLTRRGGRTVELYANVTLPYSKFCLLLPLVLHLTGKDNERHFKTPLVKIKRDPPRMCSSVVTIPQHLRG